MAETAAAGAAMVYFRARASPARTDHAVPSPAPSAAAAPAAAAAHAAVLLGRHGFLGHSRVSARLRRFPPSAPPPLPPPTLPSSPTLSPAFLPLLPPAPLPLLSPASFPILCPSPRTPPHSTTASPGGSEGTPLFIELTSLFNVNPFPTAPLTHLPLPSSIPSPNAPSPRLPHPLLLLPAVAGKALVTLRDQLTFVNPSRSPKALRIGRGNCLGKALVTLRDQLTFVNPSRSPKAFWKSAENCEALYGVVCDVNGYVTALTLVGVVSEAAAKRHGKRLGVVGPLPDAIGNLPSLSFL
ncbi:unnamed protein product [Closterium sp. NIES-64]|nr:unnamed protein product [Closterium sp. NIES-64]